MAKRHPCSPTARGSSDSRGAGVFVRPEKRSEKNGDGGVWARGRACLQTDLLTSDNEGVERALCILQGSLAYASGSTIDASSGEMYIKMGWEGAPLILGGSFLLCRSTVRVHIV